MTELRAALARRIAVRTESQNPERGGEVLRRYWPAISASGVRMVRLHGFCQSGNTFKVAFFLRALGVPWEAVHVDYMHGITRDPTWRETANEMGEVPVLE